jgi:hypothetical protein
MIAILLKVIAWIGSAVVSLLPASPFASLDVQGFGQPYIGWANWFVPFGTLFGIFSAWVAAVVVLYGLRILLKFLHVL